MSSPRLAASLRGSGSWSSCWGRFASLLRLEEVGREVRVELAPHRCFASRKWVAKLVLSSPRLAASLRLADLQPYVVLNSLSCPLSLSTTSPALCRFRRPLLPFVVFYRLSCPLSFSAASPALCCFRRPLLPFVVFNLCTNKKCLPFLAIALEMCFLGRCALSMPSWQQKNIHLARSNF